MGSIIVIYTVLVSHERTLLNSGRRLVKEKIFQGPRALRGVIAARTKSVQSMTAMQNARSFSIFRMRAFVYCKHLLLVKYGSNHAFSVICPQSVIWMY